MGIHGSQRGLVAFYLGPYGVVLILFPAKNPVDKSVTEGITGAAK
jgi:hypothetical protein